MNYELPDTVQIDKHIPTGVVIRGYKAAHLHEAFAAGAASRDVEIERLRGAARTLEQLGYTDAGGVLWKPPIGKVPDFDLIGLMEAENERQRLTTAVFKAANYTCEGYLKQEREEVDRLTAENETLQIWGQEAAAAIEALQAEVERLRGLNSDYVGYNNRLVIQGARDGEQITELRTENAALKADRDQLQRDFTYIKQVVRLKQPDLSDDSEAFKDECCECAYWLNAAALKGGA